MAEKWRCPKCGAPAGKHGKGGRDKCIQNGDTCEGLLCECDGDTEDGHGDSLSDRCENANCYHCGWGGMMPHVQDIKKWPKWARTALEAGWSPPKGWQP